MRTWQLSAKIFYLGNDQIPSLQRQWFGCKRRKKRGSQGHPIIVMKLTDDNLFPSTINDFFTDQFASGHLRRFAITHNQTQRYKVASVFVGARKRKQKLFGRRNPMESKEWDIPCWCFEEFEKIHSKKKDETLNGDTTIDSLPHVGYSHDITMDTKIVSQLFP